MKKLLIILSLIPLVIFAEEMFYTDCVSFDAGRGIWDVLCNIDIPAKNIEYREIEGKLTGNIDISIMLTNLNSGKSVTDSWETKSYISKMEEINKKLSLLDNTSFLLSSGIYEFNYTITDKNSGAKYSSSDTLTLGDIPQQPFLSDILLGISLKTDSTDSKFARNGYTIIPSPSHKTNNLNPFLILYTEIYNLTIGSPYSVNYIITDIKGDTVMILEGTRDTVREDAFFNIGGMNTIGLKNGDYLLSIAVQSDSIMINKTVSINKSSSISKQSNSKYKLSDVQLKYYNAIEYIADDAELKQYNKLSDTGKHNFLIKFWEMRDPDLSNDKLEALDKHIENIDFVNSRYSSGFENGYESDRGRIYIKYGAPDEDMQMPSTGGYKPYENWIYYSKGGIQFIFTDIKGFGKYELVYSSTIEENIPVSWESYIDVDVIRFSRD